MTILGSQVDDRHVSQSEGLFSVTKLKSIFLWTKIPIPLVTRMEPRSRMNISCPLSPSVIIETFLGYSRIFIAWVILSRCSFDKVFIKVLALIRVLSTKKEYGFVFYHVKCLVKHHFTINLVVKSCEMPYIMKLILFISYEYGPYYMRVVNM